MGKRRRRKHHSPPHNADANKMELTCESEMGDAVPLSLVDFPLPETPQKNDSPAKKRNKVGAKSENSSEVLEAIHALSLKLDQTNLKISAIEKNTELTSAKVDSLATSVQQLVVEVNTQDERLSVMEKEMHALKAENVVLKASIAESQRYSRRWSLKLHGLKEADGEDVRRITINALANVAPDIHDQLDRVIDVVHRLGRKSTSSDMSRKRPIVILFSMRRYRDVIWRAGKNSRFLLDNGLRISELMSPEDKAAREKVWPMVKKAREEGKRAIFRGPYAYIEGKRIDTND